MDEKYIELQNIHNKVNYYSDATSWIKELIFLKTAV